MKVCAYWRAIHENEDPGELKRCGTCEMCSDEERYALFDVWCQQIVDAAQEDGLAADVIQALVMLVRYCDQGLDAEASQLHVLAARAPTVLHVWLAHGPTDEDSCTVHDPMFCDREPIPERSAAYARAVKQSLN